MTPRGRLALARFAVAMTGGAIPRARRALRDARRARVPRRAAEETTLMLVLYAGYPAALEGVRALEETWPGRARASREGGRALWRRRGRNLCRRVYGGIMPRLLAHVRSRHPDLATWMIEEGYGRVLSRPGLPAATRELVTIAVLATTGWERQLVSHLKGARRLGASASEVRRAFLAGRARAGGGRRAAADRAWAGAAGSTRPRDRAGG